MYRKEPGPFRVDSGKGGPEDVAVKRWRSYSLLTGVTVLIALAVAFAINTTVNPMRVTPCAWSMKSLDPYRDIASQIRTGKAGLLREHSDWTGAFVGSSRIANGLDPKLPEWNGKRIVNLGCSAGFIYETEAICRYAVAHQKIDMVVLGLDPGDLSTDFDTREASDFYSSPFANQDEVSRELRYYFGISTLELSFETIGRSMRKELSQYTTEGLRIGKHGTGVRKGQYTFLKNSILGDIEAGMPDDRGDLTKLNERKTKMLARLLEDLHRAGIHVLVLYHPRHGLMHAHEADREAPHVTFEAERRTLCSMVDAVNRSPEGKGAIELWDFNDYHPINCEPLPRNDEETMRGWHDLGHYSLDIGHLIQARMMGWPCPVPGGEDYGTHVTPENLEAHLVQVQAGYKRYLTEDGARDVGWKESLIRESKKAR